MLAVTNIIALVRGFDEPTGLEDPADFADLADLVDLEVPVTWMHSRF